ncbi:MAG: helix-turn-helix transcriptional regulator [Phycisphaerae bacterium]|nr:helix-turn-helix transcriptional regulator [Phycisphaerae bacterium]
MTARQWAETSRQLRLSGRESQIVRFCFDDLKESAIAQRLGISQHTVHTHLERLYRKLGVASRCELIVCVFAAAIGRR